MPPKKKFNQSNQSNRRPQQNKPFHNYKPNQSDKPRTNQTNKQNKPPKSNKNTNSIAQLPKFITFGEQNSVPRSTFDKQWPYNKTFVVDFYSRAQVPVTLIDSSDKEQLLKHLSNHQQEIVLIDLDWTQNKPISLFEICTKKGVLLIHNSDKSDILVDFIKKTHFFTKGSEKIKKLHNYIGTNEEDHFIDIDEKYIIPKRYPRGFDYLLRSFLGEPNYNFRPKKIRRSDWSKKKTFLFRSDVLCLQSCF